MNCGKFKIFIIATDVLSNCFLNILRKRCDELQQGKKHIKSKYLELLMSGNKGHYPSGRPQSSTIVILLFYHRTRILLAVGVN